METNIKRVGMNITTFCNLKCKHCLQFLPYIKDGQRHSISIDEAKKVFDTCFQVIDSVEHFTVTGGEPLLNKDVYLIMEELYKYKAQVMASIDFVTNGTMEIPENLLNLFEKHAAHTKVVVSNYGENLSTKVATIEEELKKRNIPYRISKLYGDDLYYGGWIDFTDHTMKWHTIEERDANAQKCLHRVGKYFSIIDGEIYYCSRYSWRTRNGIIPKVKGEYVPLMDEAISIQEKRKYLMEMNSLKSGSSCAYCVGLCNDVPRVKPAQQL